MLNTSDIKNLVFEGGGIKGIAFVGAIRYLEECDYLKNIENIIGSSAGAIVAALISIGYTSDELEAALKKTSFDDFRDDTPGIIRDCIRLFKNYGVYKGDKLLNWIGEQIGNKTGNPDLTFLQLYDTYGFNLVITGTNLNRRQVTYFNYKDNPNMPIKVAVRISCSIPFVFRCYEYENDIYVDGGILDNYPIWYFKDSTGSCANANSHETLGFKLVTPNQHRDADIYHDRIGIKNIKDYGKCILDALLIQNERLHIKNDYWERTVTINTFDVSVTDFNIDADTKDKLIKEGYKSTADFLNTV